MLREVADTLRSTLRSYDRIIRYGGDEFICMLPGLDMAVAAERFSAVNAALAAGPQHGSVTAGLAELESGDSVEDFIARADAALYQERHRDANRRIERGRPSTGSG